MGYGAFEFAKILIPISHYFYVEIMIVIYVVVIGLHRSNFRRLEGVRYLDIFGDAYSASYTIIRRRQYVIDSNVYSLKTDALRYALSLALFLTNMGSIYLQCRSWFRGPAFRVMVLLLFRNIIWSYCALHFVSENHIEHTYVSTRTMRATWRGGITMHCVLSGNRPFHCFRRRVFFR